MPSQLGPGASVRRPARPHRRGQADGPRECDKSHTHGRLDYDILALCYRRIMTGRMFRAPVDGVAIPA